MNLLNIIKKIVKPTRNTKKRPSDDIQHLISRYDEKISELNKELISAQNESSIILESLNTKIAENESLRTSIFSLEAKVKGQTESCKEVEFSKDELRNNNLHLQEENELLVGRSSNYVLRLINFCGLLKTMGISSVEDCIEIVRNEIVQSAAEMGFDIVDSYEGDFNPKIHTIIETQITNDTNLNNHIAKVVRPGVWYDNKCLIPQCVVVYTINQ